MRATGVNLDLRLRRNFTAEAILLNEKEMVVKKAHIDDIKWNQAI